MSVSQIDYAQKPRGENLVRYTLARACRPLKGVAKFLTRPIRFLVMLICCLAEPVGFWLNMLSFGQGRTIIGQAKKASWPNLVFGECGAHLGQSTQ